MGPERIAGQLLLQHFRESLQQFLKQVLDQHCSKRLTRRSAHLFRLPSLHRFEKHWHHRAFPELRKNVECIPAGQSLELGFVPHGELNESGQRALWVGAPCFLFPYPSRHPCPWICPWSVVKNHLSPASRREMRDKGRQSRIISAQHPEERWETKGDKAESSQQSIQKTDGRERETTRSGNHLGPGSFLCQN